MRAKKCAWFFAMLIVISLAFDPSARAQSDVPHTMSFQGFITNTAGVALQGSQSFTIRLYSDSAALDKVWEDTYSVTVFQGSFQVLLGSHVALPTITGPMWLGISINGGSDLLPRTPIGASPYALSIANNIVTADKMATSYISSIVINGDTISSKASTISFGSWPHRSSVIHTGGMLRIGAPQDIDSISSPNFINLLLAGFTRFSNTLGEKLIFWDLGPTDRYGFGFADHNLNLFLTQNSRFSIRAGSYTGPENFTIDAWTGNTMVGGSLISIGNFSIANNVFNVNALTGNTSFLGDLTINNGVFTVFGGTGNTTVGGTFNSIGNLTVGNNLFLVNAFTGNTIVGGTFNSIGNLSIGNNLFLVNALTGNTIVGGTFNSIGNFSIGNNVFNINAITGNTTFIGDLNINNGIYTVNATTGNTLVGGTLHSIGNFSVANNIFVVNALTGNTIVGGTLNAIGNFSVNNNLFSVNALTGNTIVGGTFNSIGNLSIGNNIFSVNAITGNTIVGGTFNSIGNFSIGNNIFNINAITGNTVVGGTLISTGNFTVGNNIFNVNALTQTTSIAGNVSINNGLFNISSINNSVTVGGVFNMNGNLNVSNNLFTVNSVTGNTFIGGILSISNNLTIGSGNWFSVNGLNGNTNILGTLNVSGLATFGSSLNMGIHRITNLATPVSDSDAATKAYVDSHSSAGSNVLSYSTVASGGTMSSTSSVVNILDDGTNSLATATFPASPVNGQYVIVMTSDKQGATMSNGTTIAVGQAYRFVFGAGSWHGQN